MSMEDIRRFFPKGTISDEAMAAEAAEAEEWPANYPRRICRLGNAANAFRAVHNMAPNN